jgi:hypothetical protein|tara:strand:+ start:183 stop:980 length:798 start_codon:yes stop_codon:yes gene_type:complete
MYSNGKWDNPKVIMYCQIGSALDMAKFAVNSAIKNTGMSDEDVDIVFICWKTSDEVYDWLKENNYKYVDIGYDEGKGFLWNLYRGWNAGYEVAYEHADFVCPIATDHYFHTDWLANMYKHCKENRVVNCKLIEPGTLPSLHTCKNFGPTLPSQFKLDDFLIFVEDMFDYGKDKLATNEIEYGHRFDAMPFIMPKDVWERFGPMSKVLIQNSPDPQGKYVYNVTGDTDFFNRCKSGKVEVVKSLDAISYHCGGLETRINEKKGIYT